MEEPNGMTSDAVFDFENINIIVLEKKNNEQKSEPIFFKVLTKGDDFLPVGDAVCGSLARNSH